MWGKPVVLLAVMAMVAVGCGSGTSDPSTEADAIDSIRIASFDFAESTLIAELYSQALEADGFPVERLGPIGPREVVAPALELDQIDIVPEYLGTASGHFDASEPDPGALLSALEPRGLTIFEPAPAEDTNVFVVTEATAAEYDLINLSDLHPVASDGRFGGPVECPERPLCLAGLQDVYGLTFAEFVPQRSLAVTAEALLRDEIDVGLMFSTAGELVTSGLVVLRDDLDLQPPENIVPLVRLAAVDRWGPGLESSLDGVSQQLTTSDLREMNRRVEDGEPPTDVAKSWLESVGLSGS